MDLTQHYNLKKPTYGEKVDIQDLNDNADITDVQLNILADLVAKRLLKTDVSNQIINDQNKAASAATVYSVKQTLDTTNNNLAGMIFGNKRLFSFATPNNTTVFSAGTYTDINLDFSMYIKDVDYIGIIPMGHNNLSFSLVSKTTDNVACNLTIAVYNNDSVDIIRPYLFGIVMGTVK